MNSTREIMLGIEIEYEKLLYHLEELKIVDFELYAVIAQNLSVIFSPYELEKDKAEADNNIYIDLHR